MTKKSFTDNPAINFMSTPEPKQAQQLEHTAGIDNTENTVYTYKTEKTLKKRKSDGAAKKDYRLNLLITRKLRDTLQTLADFDRRSLNALINDALAAYAADRETDYETYTAFLKKTEAARQKADNDGRS